MFRGLSSDTVQIQYVFTKKDLVCTVLLNTDCFLRIRMNESNLTK